MSNQTLIDELRADEMNSIQSEVREGRRVHILKTLDERGRAQELVRQQYTGRYPFELLQNANDAAADVGSSGHTVRFVLTESALIVCDEGCGFGAEQIRAICGLGRSSKDPRKSIGYKGLGFKSVGEITERPQIMSAGVRFTFDEDRARRAVEESARGLREGQRIPVYALPFPLVDSDIDPDLRILAELENEGFRTILRFPFKDGVDRQSVQSHVISTLSPRVLLFLGAVDQLQLRGTSDDFEAHVKRERHGYYSEALLETGGSLEHWLVFEREVPIPERSLVTPLGDAWKEIEKVRVAAAIPLDKQQQATQSDKKGDGIGKSEPLTVYFPTEETSGLPFVLQADFALELDRRHIARSPEAEPYNQWLAHELGCLVAEDVAPRLDELLPDGASAVAAIAPRMMASVPHRGPRFGIGSPPAPRTEATPFGQVVLDRCVEALRNARFITCVDGEKRCPSEVYLPPALMPTPEESYDVLELSQFGILVGVDTVADVNACSFLVGLLNVKELDSEDILRRCTPPKERFEERYYAVLLAWSKLEGTSAFAKRLESVPCVRTISGHWRAPSEGLIFDRQRGELEFSVEFDLPIVPNPPQKELRELFQAAGVRPFEWRGLLPDFVLPLLTDPDTSSDLRHAAMNAVVGYFETKRDEDPQLKSQMSRILLPVTDAAGDQRGLRPAAQTYFSSAWLEQDSLEQIYGPFGHAEFLAEDPLEQGESSRRTRAFYEWLGVEDKPRIDTCRSHEGRTWTLPECQEHPHRKYRAHWDAWTSSEDYHHAGICGQRHPQSQQLRESYALDRFPDLVQSGDRKRLVLLWRELNQKWSAYRAAMSAVAYCRARTHSGERERRLPSLFQHMLREVAWVPVLKNSVHGLVKPRDAWRLANGTPRRVAESIPVIDPSLESLASAALVADLGIIDAARPSARDLVTLLRHLRDEHETEPQGALGSTRIAGAARWAMRQLNAALENGDTYGDDSVPLLAKIDGRQVFHDAPFVADDPLLKETWETTHPIFDGDKELRTLKRVSRLRCLDDEVEIRPVPRRQRDDIRKSVENEFRKASPYLAAVAAEAVPSRRDEIFRGLSRLRLLVCEELVLEYRLEDEVRSRPEAVSFIAETLEQDRIVRRRIGTAHLEISGDNHAPDWFVFGNQLADFLGVPTQGDAFALLLESSTEKRKRYVTNARRITLEDVDKAQTQLEAPPKEEHRGEFMTPAEENDVSVGSVLTDETERNPGDIETPRTEAGHEEDHVEAPRADVDRDEDAEGPRADVDRGEDVEAPRAAGGRSEAIDARKEGRRQAHTGDDGGAATAPSDVNGHAEDVQRARGADSRGDRTVNPGRAPGSSESPMASKSQRSPSTKQATTRSGTNEARDEGEKIVTPLPELDPASLSITDAPDDGITADDSFAGLVREPGLGPAGPVDFGSRGRTQRIIGERGEEAVYHAERNRLLKLGLDADQVIWRSRDYPAAPYDIESLDADGQRIFIEVKATTSSQAGRAFEISERELRFAMQKRETYYVYRVTNIGSSAPAITRYKDPIGRIEAGNAHLRWKEALLAFKAASFDDEEGEFEQPVL